jgi:hypothetical protein
MDTLSDRRAPGPARLLLLLCLLVPAVPLVGCSDGEECDECQTDADCVAPLVCVGFNHENGESAGRRCGSGVGASTCRVR